MSNLNANQWEERLNNEGISTLDVWSMVVDMRKLEDTIKDLRFQVSAWKEMARELYGSTQCIQANPQEVINKYCLLAGLPKVKTGNNKIDPSEFDFPINR